VTLFVNGKHYATSRSAGTYAEIRRKWQTGDVVDVRLPMKLRTQPLPSATDLVAVLYGPIVLAGRLGKEQLSAGADLIENERTSGEMLNSPVSVPDWIGRPDEFSQRIERSPGAALLFRAGGFEGGRSIELAPYYEIAHERYTLYWRVRAPQVG
jgi:DUF1680 family protein